MSRWAEIAIFAAIAAALHIIFFAAAPKSGSEAGGVGGEAIVSVAAAAQTIVDMVETWEQPVQAQPVMETELETPTEPAEPAPTPPAMDISQAPRTEIQLALLPPEEKQELDIETQPATSFVQTPKTHVDPLETLRPPTPETTEAPSFKDVKRSQALRPITQMALMQPEQTQPLEIETTPPEPKTKPKPKVKPKPNQKQKAQPKPKQEAPKTGKKAKQNSAGRAEQESAGSGGTAQAGSSKSVQVSTQSKGQKAKLRAIWGSKVRFRIARRQRYPSGATGKGQVHVRLTLSRDGRLLGLKVIRSSGIAAFDQEAIRAVKSAGRFPKAPKNLPGGKFTFDLPLSFNKKR